MSLTHDIIKIKYSKLGYLPSYPYHLISDEEMFNAFINLTNEESDADRFFEDNYPNPFAEQDLIYKKLNPQGEVISEVSLSGEYTKLKDYIIKVINTYLQYQGTESADLYVIPDWIYTYMLGEVVYNNSEYLDIYDTLALLGDNSINNKFTNKSCALCYATSLKYISTLTSGLRPPTVFGEPHVIKQLRLEA
jgi:hypothetical protein